MVGFTTTTTTNICNACHKTAHTELKFPNGHCTVDVFRDLCVFHPPYGISHMIGAVATTTKIVVSSPSLATHTLVRVCAGGHPHRLHIYHLSTDAGCCWAHMANVTVAHAGVWRVRRHPNPWVRHAGWEFYNTRTVHHLASSWGTRQIYSVWVVLCITIHPSTTTLRCTALRQPTWPSALYRVGCSVVAPSSVATFRLRRVVTVCGSYVVDGQPGTWRNTRRHKQQEGPILPGVSEYLDQRGAVSPYSDRRDDWLCKAPKERTVHTRSPIALSHPWPQQAWPLRCGCTCVARDAVPHGHGRQSLVKSHTVCTSRFHDASVGLRALRNRRLARTKDIPSAVVLCYPSTSGPHRKR